MSPEDAKMAVLLQLNDEFTCNHLCYESVALIVRPKPLIPHISRGEGVPIISLCLVRGKECYLAETVQQFVVHASPRDAVIRR